MAFCNFGLDYLVSKKSQKKKKKKKKKKTAGARALKLGKLIGNDE